MTTILKPMHLATAVLILYKLLFETDLKASMHDFPMVNLVALGVAFLLIDKACSDNSKKD